MKKLLFTLAIGLATLTSCESDLVSAPPNDSAGNASGSSSNDGILPTEVDIVYSDGSTETIEYTYDGMSLSKEESTDGYYTDYVYEDSRLTEINYYDAPSNPILESYTYDTEGRVATVTTNIVGTGIYEYSLSYNADNSVITNTSITNPGGTPSTTTLSNGNMVSDNEGGVITTTYTHDDKNAPFKNIANRNILVTINSENAYNFQFNRNNELTLDTVGGSFPESISSSYTYTSLNYPRVMTENEGGDITTYTYTYNND
jgi:hypothetical protein